MPRCAIAYCPSLPFHSTKTKIATRIIVVKAFPILANLGIEKREDYNISEI
jgi:hypothetical protein